MGEAHALVSRLAGLPALLHCVEADPSKAPRVAAAGVPAVARTQSHRPRGSRRRGGGEGGEGNEGGKGVEGGGEGGEVWSPGQLQPEQSQPFLEESWAQV